VLTIISERLRPKVICFLLVASFTRVAHADSDEQKAMTLFEQGRKLAREGRCAEAIAPLLSSVQYLEGVGPLLNLGHCYESLGKTASAHRYFLRAREVAGARLDRRREEADQRVRALESELSTLTIHVPAAMRTSARVEVDGEPWPRERWETPSPVDPGAHKIEVDAPPQPRESTTIVVRGTRDAVEWTLPSPKTAPALASQAPTPAAPPEEPPSTQRTLGLVAGGTGIATLVAGAIFGALSFSAHSSVLQTCPSYPQCRSSDRAALEDLNGRAQTTGNVATVAVVAGAILLTGGVTLFFTAPRR
jgi:hypothetical protein